MSNLGMNLRLETVDDNYNNILICDNRKERRKSTKGHNGSHKRRDYNKDKNKKLIAKESRKKNRGK